MDYSKLSDPEKQEIYDTTLKYCSIICDKIIQIIKANMKLCPPIYFATNAELRRRRDILIVKRTRDPFYSDPEAMEYLERNNKLAEEENIKNCENIIKNLYSYMPEIPKDFTEAEDFILKHLEFLIETKKEWFYWDMNYKPGAIIQCATTPKILKEILNYFNNLPNYPDEDIIEVDGVEYQGGKIMLNKELGYCI